MSEIGAQLERRRRAVAERWNLDREVVVIGAGHPVPVPGRGDIDVPVSQPFRVLLPDRS